MRVHELAAKLKMTTAELRPFVAKVTDIGHPHQRRMLSNEEVRQIKADVAASRRPPPTKGAASAPTLRDEPERSKSPLIAFGSLKGGVGKTTLSLCAAELLRTTGKRWPVVIIDADVAGTELSWVWNERCDETDGEPTYTVQSSLLDLLLEPPDRRSVLDELLAALPTLSRFTNEQSPTSSRMPSSKYRGLLVPTFTPGTESTLESLEWKRVLEGSSRYAERALERLLRSLRNQGVAVVVDLPAFDVGFAHYAHNAVVNAEGTYFLVTDGDVRSLQATLHYLRAKSDSGDITTDSWKHVVVNSVSDQWTPNSFVEMLGKATGQTGSPAQGQSVALKAGAIPILMRATPRTREATQVGSHARELFDAIRAQTTGIALTEQDRGRLRDEAQK